MTPPGCCQLDSGNMASQVVLLLRRRVPFTALTSHWFSVKCLFISFASFSTGVCSFKHLVPGDLSKWRQPGSFFAFKLNDTPIFPLALKLYWLVQWHGLCVEGHVHIKRSHGVGSAPGDQPVPWWVLGTHPPHLWSSEWLPISPDARCHLYLHFPGRPPGRFSPLQETPQTHRHPEAVHCRR